MPRRAPDPLPQLPGQPIDLTPLSRWERMVLDLIVEAADARRLAPTSEDIEEVCECSLSTAVDIVRMLEQRGLIMVQRYQRARRIKVLTTGKWTARVANKTPHWRTQPRPPTMPVPSPNVVRDRRPDFAREVMHAARVEHMELGEFLAELAWTGWQARLAAIQEQADEA